MKHIHHLTTALLLSCLATPALSEVVPQKSFDNKPSASAPSLLERIKDRLPSITFVKQPYVRDVVVLKVNCPVEVLTGITIPPIELARQALDQTAMKLNEREIFKYDIQFVCG